MGLRWHPCQCHCLYRSLEVSTSELEKHKLNCVMCAVTRLLIVHGSLTQLTPRGLWVQHYDLPVSSLISLCLTARFGAHLFYRTFTNCLYMFGGWSRTRFVNDLYQYNITSRMWTQLLLSSPNGTASTIVGSARYGIECPQTSFGLLT